MKLIIGAFCVIFFLLSACSPSSDATSKKDKKVLSLEKTKQVSKQSEFSIPVYTFDEFEHLLHQKNDSVYVVNFWATWCKPCVEELPYFEALNETHKEDNIKVVLVSLDFVGQTKKVEKFIEKNALKSSVVHLNDSNNSEWIDKVHKSWTGSIPATYIYQNDKVDFYEQSFHSEAELEELLLDFVW